jgi:hypothetical protein
LAIKRENFSDKDLKKKVQVYTSVLNQSIHLDTQVNFPIPQTDSELQSAMEIEESVRSGHYQTLSSIIAVTPQYFQSYC